MMPYLILHANIFIGPVWEMATLDFIRLKEMQISISYTQSHGQNKE